MSVYLLFMDDSCDPTTNILALTGILVPVDRYEALRSRFYAAMSWATVLPDGALDLYSHELHASELLSWYPGADDELKFKMFEEIARLVTEYELGVYRVAYARSTMTYSDPTDGICKIPDSFIMQFALYGLLKLLEPVLASNQVIPIMDGFNGDTVPGFSGLVKTMDQLRAFGHGHAISIDNTANVIGEVLYADSRFSIFIQVADLVGYLLQARDRFAAGQPLTPFKERLYQISTKLDPHENERAAGRRQTGSQDGNEFTPRS